MLPCRFLGLDLCSLFFLCLCFPFLSPLFSRASRIHDLTTIYDSAVSSLSFFSFLVFEICFLPFFFCSYFLPL